MCDEQPAYVGYKLIAIQVELLSHDGQIYMDSLLQKQAILRLSDLVLGYFINERYPVFDGIRMIDIFFIM